MKLTLSKRTPHQAKILTARAVRLAKLREDDEQRSEVQLLAFDCAGYTFAVRMEQTEGIYRLPEFTPVPGSPSHLLGMVRVRGRFVALVEPRELLAVSVAGMADATKMVVVTDQDRVVALAVNDVRDVLSLSQKELDSARPTGDGLTRALNVGGDALALIDLPALFRERLQ